MNQIEAYDLDSDFYLYRSFVNCAKDTPDFRKALDDLHNYEYISHGSDTSYVKAYILNALGKYEDALFEYNNCLEKTPDTYDCIIGRAQAYFNTNHLSEACADLKKCERFLKKNCKCTDPNLDKLKLKYGCK